jgi:hypothetical protein
MALLRPYRSLQLLSMVFILTSCAHEFEIKSEYDPYTGLTKTTSNNVFLADQELESNEPPPEVDEVFLSTIREKSGLRKYYINVVNNYWSNRRELHYAVDDHGNKLRAFWSTHQLNCRWSCGYDEYLQIEVSPDYMQAHRSKGLSFQLYGPAETETLPVYISPQAFSQFLDKVGQ